MSTVAFKIIYNLLVFNEKELFSHHIKVFPGEYTPAPFCDTYISFFDDIVYFTNSIIVNHWVLLVILSVLLTRTVQTCLGANPVP